MTWKLLADETVDEYIYRVCSHKDEIGTWFDVADIINDTLNYNKDSSTYRKSWESFTKLLNIHEKNNCTEDEYAENINALKRSLEMERKKLQTEKLEYNRWLRENARDELYLEKITDAIKARDVKLDIPKPISTTTNHNNEALLCIADAHYGKEFKIYGVHGEVLNEYSPEIFEERMQQILNKTVEICKKEGITLLHVINLGDSVEGLIRNSQIWSLRWGVVDSAINFGNFMAAWLNELSKYVKVEYRSIMGNHEELRLLSDPKNAHLNESTDKIIQNIIKISNADNPNFELIENKTNVIYDKVCGFNIVGIHGEVKNVGKAIDEYENIYGIDIDYLLTGHMHHASSLEVSNKSMCLGIGSIVGSDEYSMRLRRSADASANLFIFDEEDGLIQSNRIVLN